MIASFTSTVHDAPILLREEYDTQSRHYNKLRKIQNSVQNIPFRNSEVVHGIAELCQEYKWCKMVLMRRNCSLDIFAHIKDYLFVPDMHILNSYPRLVPRNGLRIVSKLIQSEFVVDIPMALQIAHNYDKNAQKNIYLMNLHQELQPYINLPFEYYDIFSIWFYK